MDTTTTAVVIDAGSNTCRGGLSRDTTPPITLRTLTGKHPDENDMYSHFKATTLCKRHNDILAGDELSGNCGHLTRTYPVTRGTVTDWSHMESIIMHIYNRLGAKPEDQPILLTEPPLNPKSNRTEAAEYIEFLIVTETPHITNTRVKYRCLTSVCNKIMARPYPNRDEECDPKVEKRSKEHISCKTIDDLYALMVKCPSANCCGKQYHCPVCSHIKPTKPNKIMKHIKNTHWKNAHMHKDEYLLRCYDICRTRPHYHCPEDGCVKMFTNTNHLASHLQNHESQTSNPEQSMCTDCGAAVLSKNLNRHMKQHTHTQYTGLQASCVDSCNGLFLVTKTKRGRQDPIHVQHQTWGTNHQIQCSDKNCRDAKKIAIESGRCGWICDHIKLPNTVMWKVKTVICRKHA